MHVHILPRKLSGDRFEHAKDEIYPALEDAEAELPNDLLHAAMTKESTRNPLMVQRLKVDADDARVPRDMEDMAKEAEWLKSFFEQSIENDSLTNSS